MKLFKYKNQTGLKALFFLAFIAVCPLNAEAYIDPGTGSIIIQAVVASVLVGGFYFRVIWKKIRGFFGYFLNRDKKEEVKKEETTQSDEHIQQQEQQ